MRLTRVRADDEMHALVYAVPVKPTDPDEMDLIESYESGEWVSIATKAELERLREAARATATKDRRVNIRLSSADLQDIQVKAMEEGMPYQTLIASVLHKFVTGRLAEVEDPKLTPGAIGEEEPRRP